MKSKQNYYKMIADGMEKLFMDIRTTLAEDLKSGVIDQATFDACDLECEHCLLEVQQEAKDLQ
ncbi:hypothetical protein AHMF7605_10330 [Adhaeribacter arboris]|uniref:Uncharacterized protein n=1 Tax=Adhaeribacter arboris TaxID=2072846 RepID=A0A2T2YEE8_9BACT|nr:hypothetical protein [Adhaeribacter arboris]PSR53884.1 hypothetical protein AHMF7605_10330 [Adhaeribacter arboris]